jgi:hypothetical protein
MVWKTAHDIESAIRSTHRDLLIVTIIGRLEGNANLGFRDLPSLFANLRRLP